jgi:hypothetical protein
MIDRLRREFFWAGFGLIFAFLLVCMLIQVTPFKILFGITAFVTGWAACFGMWRYSASAQWPLIASCIDRSKVEARLRELDA